MKKLRLSYSLMSLWERGDVDGAISTYFHLDRPSTPQMDKGRQKHEEVAKYIDEHGKFPNWFFEYGLKLPKTEKEMVVSYNDLFDLKCYMDCLDRSTNTLFEYKFSVSNSLTWARTYQLPLYFLIAELGKVKIDKALVIRHNDEQSDFCIVYNNQTQRDKAKNYIDSVAPEIHEHFVNEGLL